jgi:hypothetical protein
MSWIKRNLYFLIGSVLAMVLLGLSGWYLFTKWQFNKQELEVLNKAYTQLKDYAGKKPNPGDGKVVDNITIAREQQVEISAIVQQAGKYFAPIPPIPAHTNSMISDEDFKAALLRTIARLERDAADASVILQPKYNFSFEAQQPIVKFTPPGSLEPLAAQLGEIKTICSVLFRAKVNSLDNLRRERISEDDLKGPQSDYLDERSVTNDLAVLTPYEVTFHCFSKELADVLAGFANEPHGIIVRTINVESGALTGSADQFQMAPAQAMQSPAGAPPMAGRGGRGYGTYEAAPVSPALPAMTGRGGLPIILDEKQLKVTLVLEIIKLLPKKQI